MAGRRELGHWRWPARAWPAALLAVLYGASALGIALTPTLAPDAPLALLALRPTFSILLLVGGSVPVLPALLIAVPLRVLFDVCYFGLSRANLRAFALRRPLGRRLVDALSARGAERALLCWCLVNTNPAVDAALGGSRVSWRRFLAFVVPGTVLMTSVYLAAARAAAPWARDLLVLIDRHATQALLLLLAVGAAHLGVAAARSAIRRRRSPAAAGEAGTEPGTASTAPS